MKHLFKKNSSKMKKALFPLLLFIMLFGCKSKNSSSEKEKDSPVVAIQKEAAIIYDKILGSFVGAFGDNKIMVLITRATKDSVLGRSVVGGNDRPFVGTLSVKDGKYMITAKEPGDDKHDGIFNFTYDEAKANTLEGNWAPNNTKITAKKEYVLQRKSFEYKADAGFYKASQKLLKASDVENLTKSDLETMRNEIFARHGYCFKKKESRDYFENEEWYVPNTVDVKDKLTDIEKKNIALIKRYEKYAVENGDDFGR
jgi:YARHG domain